MATPTRLQTEDVLLEIGPWSEGVVNAKPGQDLPKTAAQDALNVDITDAGNARRRRGSKKILTASRPHSLFATDDLLLHAEGANLIASTNNGSWQSEILFSGLSAGEKLYWESAQGSAWWSNGVQQGRVVGGVNKPFALEAPTDNPVLEAQASGGQLPPGIYSVSVCFVSARGEESAATARVSAEIPKNRDAIGTDLAETGRLIIRNLPDPATEDIAFVRIYLSDANGTVLYRYADLPAGTTMQVVSTRPRNKGMPASNEAMDLFPPCKMLQLFRGWMFGAIGDTLIYSEPQRLGLWSPNENFFRFDSDITMVAAVDDGVYVATQRKTYWLSGAGEPTTWSREEKLPYGGAAVGSLVAHPNEPLKMWWMNGEIVAGPGGQIKNATIQKIAPKKYPQAASFFRRENGVEQVVNVFQKDGGAQLLGAQSFTDAEIIRARQS